jgi:hypothetical protein
MLPFFSKDTAKSFVELMNTPVAMCLILAWCMNTVTAGIVERMDRMMIMVTAIESRHASTPALLSEISRKVETLCGECRRCRKTEVNGTDG